METMIELVEGLQGGDPGRAYSCFLQLQEKSRHSAAVYAYFDRFAAMIDSDSAYVRTRGLLLIAANARWDAACKIDAILDAYLAHITDVKPTVSRQLIAVLPGLAQAKPELAGEIRQALVRANPGRYRASMAPLVQRDIAKALSQMAE